jgi:hypothetical protein
MGCLLTAALPAPGNTPEPVPSGLHVLCADRLSRASSNQNVAVTTERPAGRPNRRHMLPTGRAAVDSVPPGRRPIAVFTRATELEVAPRRD